MLLGLCPGVVSGNTFSAVNAYSSAMFYVVIYVLTIARHLRHDPAAVARRLRGRDHRRLQGPGEAQPVVRRRDGGAACSRSPAFRRRSASTPSWRCCRRWSRPTCRRTSGWRSSRCVLSLLGAFYYLRVVKLMYFDEPTDVQPIGGAADVRIMLSLNGAAVLLLGILPGGLMRSARRRSCRCSPPEILDERRRSMRLRRPRRRHRPPARNDDAVRADLEGPPSRRPPRPRQPSRRQRGAARVHRPPGRGDGRGDARRRPPDRRAAVAPPDRPGLARVPRRQARGRRAAARLRGPRAVRGNRLPRRRMGARRRHPQRHRLRHRGDRDLVRPRPQRRRAAARRRRVPRRRSKPAPKSSKRRRRPAS